MLVEEVVGERDHLRVELLPAVALVPADKQECSALRVEGEEYADRARAQLLHIRVARAFHAVDEWPPESRSTLLQQANRGVDRLLIIHAQHVPPLLESVCNFDVPHLSTIPYSAYAVNSIVWAVACEAAPSLLCGVVAAVDRLDLMLQALEGIAFV